MRILLVAIFLNPTFFLLGQSLEKNNDDSTKVNTLNTIAENHYNLDIKKSLEYAQHALRISERLHYDKGSIRASNILTNVHRRLGNYEAAIRYTLNTLPIVERLKDSTEIFNSTIALGNIYTSMEKYTEAMHYLRTAYALGVKINSPGLSSVLNFIGRNFNQLKQYDSALYYIEHALVLENKNPRPGYTLSYIYNNLADVYYNLEDYPKSQEYYSRSLALPEGKKSPYGITFTLNGLARIYQQSGDLDKAIAISLQSIRISEHNTYRDKAKETYGILYKVYEQKKDFKNALHYYKQFNFYQDTLSGEEKLKAIEDLKINYETKRIETENQLLRKSAELKDAELKQRFIQGWAFLFGTAALLFLIFLLYRHNKQRTKTNQLLNQYNRDLAEQVYKRTLDLVDSNTELIRQNNQLEQFGYIIAHNLRAPVARILGLTNIINSPDFNMPADQKVIERLQLTSKELDTVIHDLNSILDIKKGINNTLERIDLMHRLEKVKENLREKIRESNTIINSDFSAVNVLFAIPAYIESILYNLISNAIKYKSEYRSPLIDLSTHIEEGMVYITVEDNGIGIDLENQKDKLFNLYQRFHSHVEGKGMGLFLVKTQIEAMNGKIEVQSQVNVGTTFKICLPLNPLT
jgi:signal transduction histidine kinase